MIAREDLIRGLRALMDAPRANLREPEAGYALAGFTVKAKSLFNKVRAGGKEERRACDGLGCLLHKVISSRLLPFSPSPLLPFSPSPLLPSLTSSAASARGSCTPRISARRGSSTPRPLPAHGPTASLPPPRRVTWVSAHRSILHISVYIMLLQVYRILL